MLYSNVFFFLYLRPISDDDYYFMPVASDVPGTHLLVPFWEAVHSSGVFRELSAVAVCVAATEDIPSNPALRGESPDGGRRLREPRNGSPGTPALAIRMESRPEPPTDYGNWTITPSNRQSAEGFANVERARR